MLVVFLNTLCDSTKLNRTFTEELAKSSFVLTISSCCLTICSEELTKRSKGQLLS